MGKKFVSQEILTKPGPLNAAEFAQMKSHPEAGYALLKDNPFPCRFLRRFGSTTSAWTAQVTQKV
jgi:HD-GYP domain-containing protein (c-di-GMP phosphodiesterase class II)